MDAIKNGRRDLVQYKLQSRKWCSSDSYHSDDVRRVRLAPGALDAKLLFLAYRNDPDTVRDALTVLVRCTRVGLVTRLTPLFAKVLIDTLKAFWDHIEIMRLILFTLEYCLENSFSTSRIILGDLVGPNAACVDDRTLIARATSICKTLDKLYADERRGETLLDWLGFPEDFIAPVPVPIPISGVASTGAGASIGPGRGPGFSLSPSPITHFARSAVAYDEVIAEVMWELKDEGPDIAHALTVVASFEKNLEYVEYIFGHRIRLVRCLLELCMDDVDTVYNLCRILNIFSRHVTWVAPDPVLARCIFDAITTYWHHSGIVRGFLMWFYSCVACDQGAHWHIFRALLGPSAEDARGRTLLARAIAEYDCVTPTVPGTVERTWAMFVLALAHLLGHKTLEFV